MNAGYLLDTSAAILARDAPSLSNSGLLTLDIPPALSIVSRVELDGGVFRQPALAPQRRALLNRLLATLRIIDFDAACADKYQAIVRDCGFSRRKLLDRMIAATALAHDLTLITANASDFREVPGLELIVW